MIFLSELTFPLAVIAYSGLGIAVIVSLRRPLPRLLTLPVAGLVTAHVFLIWAYRYEWQLSQATRNGYVGFAIFHSALLLILASAIAPQRAAPWLVRVAFCIVTMGAIGAVFRYEEVAGYRVAVLGVGLIGSWELVRAWERPLDLGMAAPASSS